MKFTPFVFAILLSLQFSNSLAADFLCQQLTGQLSDALKQDDSCMVHDPKNKNNYFPDLEFKKSQGPLDPVCFSAEFEGTLVSGSKTINIKGKVHSALTNSNFDTFDPLALTAASIITVDDKFKLYTQDLIVEPFAFFVPSVTKERLTIVANNIGKNIKGHLDVNGNALSEAVSFGGPVCIK